MSNQHVVVERDEVNDVLDQLEALKSKVYGLIIDMVTISEVDALIDSLKAQVRRLKT